MMSCLLKYIALLLSWHGLLSTSAVVAESTQPNRWTATSDASYFQVVLEPVNHTLVLNDYMSWHLNLFDAKGKPLERAKVAIGAGMFGKGHGHGMSTSPVVTGYLGGGKYLVEGVFFNMLGVWSVFLDIQTELLQDRARIDIDFDASKL